MVVCSPSKAWKKWVWLSWVLGREGGDAQMLELFYVAVVQVVFLYVSETWVMSPCIGRIMGGFRHRVI